MKKYLITGALSLVASATFISCHTDDDFGSSIVEQKMLAYEQVFEEEFGKVDPNQDWGFGSAERLSRTRSAYAGRTRGEIDPNLPQGEDARGNMWCLDWNVPDTLTAGQKLRVQKYFQYNQYPGGTTDPKLVNFFVQQVYDGFDDPLTKYDKTMIGDTLKYSEEQYLAADQRNYIQSGEHMDWLTAGSDNVHINNFNNGNCGVYPNVKDGYTYEEGWTPYTEETAAAAGKTWEDAQTENFNHLAGHPDKIMLMLNTKTDCFGYWNSNGSVGHNDRYRLVSAAVIDAWIDANLGENYGDKVVDKWNRDFIGFDFDQVLTEDCYAGQRTYGPPYTPENNYQGELVSAVYTYYKPEIYGETYHYLRSEQNFYCGQKQHIDPEPTGNDALTLLQEGWLPVIDTANKDWVKVGGCADGYFSDWIVTICKAEPTEIEWNEPNIIEIPIEPGSQGAPLRKDFYYMQTSYEKNGSGRVFCEDLGVVRASDIDFNDIVFDVYIYKTLYYTEHRILIDGEWILDTEHYENAVEYTDSTFNGDVWLLAGGGTIPASIQVAGNSYSIKNVYGDPDITDKWIINTIENDEGRYGNHYKIIQRGVKLNDEPLAITSVADVDVYVTYDGHVGKLVAYKGAAPHKICVPIGTKWLKEREEINLGYPSFDKYVKSQDINGKYIDHEGVIPYNGPEGGYIGDGNEYNNNYNRAFDYVWVETEETSAHLYQLPVPYTPRHEAHDWDGSIISLGSQVTGGGGINSGFQNGDPVLIRRRH